MTELVAFMTVPALDLDLVIIGGGAAGLWLLDDVVRAGYDAVLLEAFALGSGQTIASQGIIHGGLKYSLRGIVSPAARAIREMPEIWRRALAGEADPDLSAVDLRSDHCVLWHTTSMTSRLAMFGARKGLRAAPVSIDRAARPEVLRDTAGTVARVDEQVIEPGRFLQVLAERHAERVLHIDAGAGVHFERSGPNVTALGVTHPGDGSILELRPRTVVLTAGAGNAALRRAAGLETEAMQRRPLHMVVARHAAWPAFNGHCVDGMHTRATITSTRDAAGRTIWQIGGQIAEDGVTQDPAPLIARAAAELREILPALDLTGAEWTTYRVDRAEPKADGERPDESSVLRDANLLTAWPTKLALAPRLSAQVREHLAAPYESDGTSCRTTLRSWPRPPVSAPPWEEGATWITAP